jgi:prolyl-tRNA editing enzyme YbaK/EbsC (Cys-tRNA(Pro) deacylase)
MNKAINLVLTDRDVIELLSILIDGDAELSLAFLKKHFKGKARELLEGG